VGLPCSFSFFFADCSLVRAQATCSSTSATPPASTPGPCSARPTRSTGTRSIRSRSCARSTRLVPTLLTVFFLSLSLSLSLSPPALTPSFRVASRRCQVPLLIPAFPHDLDETRKLNPGVRSLSPLLLFSSLSSPLTLFFYSLVPLPAHLRWC
jgi:hypothetical protein